MTHEEDIRADKPKMEHFEMVYGKATKFMGDDMPEKEKFFLIFCRTWINSHSIYTGTGVEIGMAIDLEVSRYNHNCRPTATLIFDGYRAVFRALKPGIDLNNTDECFIAYTDVGRSKYRRRRELKIKWYFDCECSRCSDPDDDILTALKCPTANCDAPLVTTEDSEPINIACPKCKQIADSDFVSRGQELMRKLPDKFDFNTDPEQAENCKKLLAEAKSILHPENIYYCRLLTACMQILPDDRDLDDPDMHKLVYSNYKRCFPETDRHRGYQLLHLVKSLIQQKRRTDAIPYAFEAMTIFEVCFGLDHPYYLQTLALWTYLDKRIDKTDDQLLSLMNFGSDRRVDVGQILSKVGITPNENVVFSTAEQQEAPGAGAQQNGV